MNYLAAIRNIFTVVAIVLFSSIGFAGHVSAMSTTSHDTRSGSHHSTSQSPSCVALCTTATLKEKAGLDYEEKDDEPTPLKSSPFYALNSGNFIPQKLASNYVHSQLILRPPDLIKLYSNFRF